jgi:NAD+ synthase
MVTPLQQHIIETLNVKKTIDPETEFRSRVDFAKELLLTTSMKGYVLGISGGLDSALSGRILAQATTELKNETDNEEYKFIAMLLPYGVQGDGEEAKLLAHDFIKADRVIELNIKPMVDALEESYNASVDGDKLSDFNKGNAKARARCSAQYTVGSQFGLLVGGSDNANEATIGYFSKGGDGFFDACPISGLTKAQEIEIMRFLDAPSFVITKKPTADLLDGKPQQADEDELGVTYAETNSYLAGEDINPAAQAIIEQRYIQTEHKRQLPITPFDTWWKEPISVV